MKIVITVFVDGFQQQAKISEPVIHPLFDVVSRSGVELKINGRIAGMKTTDQLRQGLYSGQVPAAEGYGAFYQLSPGGDLLLGLAHQFKDFLSTAAQQQAFTGQCQPPVAAVKQHGTHLLLQLGNLPAERRLGDMQRLGSTGNVPLLGNN